MYRDDWSKLSPRFDTSNFSIEERGVGGRGNPPPPPPVLTNKRYFVSFFGLNVKLAQIHFSVQHIQTEIGKEKRKEKIEKINKEERSGK